MVKVKFPYDTFINIKRSILIVLEGQELELIPLFIAAPKHDTNIGYDQFRQILEEMVREGRLIKTITYEEQYKPRITYSTAN